MSTRSSVAHGGRERSWPAAGGLPDPLAHPCALERLQGLAVVLNDAALGERGKGSAVLVEGEFPLVESVQ